MSKREIYIILGFFFILIFLPKPVFGAINVTITHPVNGTTYNSTQQDLNVTLSDSENLSWMGYSINNTQNVTISGIHSTLENSLTKKTFNFNESENKSTWIRTHNYNDIVKAKLNISGYGWPFETNLTEATSFVRSVAFSPNNNWIGYGSYDNNVYIYNTTDWSLETTLTQSTGAVYSVAFSPDGKWIAYGGADYNIYIHNTTDWSLETTLTEATGNVNSIDFSPNGKWISYGSSDNNVYIHNTTDWSFETNLTESTYIVVSVTFSENNNYIAYGGVDNNVYIHNTTDWSFETNLTQSTGVVESIDFSSNNNWTAYGSVDTNVYVHNTTDWSLETTLTNPDQVYSVTFSQNDQWIAHGGLDDNVYVHNTTDWSLETTLTEATGDVNSIDFSSDNNWIGYGSDDENVYIHYVFEFPDNPWIDVADSGYPWELYMPGTELKGTTAYLDQFNNSKTEENLTFTGNENITRWIELPKNSNVSKAELRVSAGFNASTEKILDETNGCTLPKYGYGRNDSIKRLYAGCGKKLYEWTWNETENRFDKKLIDTRNGNIVVKGIGRKSANDPTYRVYAINTSNSVIFEYTYNGTQFEITHNQSFPIHGGCSGNQFVGNNIIFGNLRNGTDYSTFIHGEGAYDGTWQVEEFWNETAGEFQDITLQSDAYNYWCGFTYGKLHNDGTTYVATWNSYSGNSPYLPFEEFYWDGNSWVLSHDQDMNCRNNRCTFTDRSVGDLGNGTSIFARDDDGNLKVFRWNSSKGSYDVLDYPSLNGRYYSVGKWFDGEKKLYLDFDIVVDWNGSEYVSVLNQTEDKWFDCKFGQTAVDFFNRSKYRAYGSNETDNILKECTYSNSVNNPYIQTANSGGPAEWSYSGEFNQSVSPKTADLNTTLFNDCINTKTADENGTVDCKLLFHSDTAGKLEVSNINMQYNPNPIDLNATLFNQYCTQTDCDLPIKLHSDTPGELELSDIFLKYYNKTQILTFVRGDNNITVYANDTSGTWDTSFVLFRIREIYKKIATGVADITDKVKRVPTRVKFLPQSFQLTDKITRLSNIFRIKSQLLEAITSILRQASIRRIKAQVLTLNHAVTRLTNIFRTKTQILNTNTQIQRLTQIFRIKIQPFSVNTLTTRISSISRIKIQPFQITDKIRRTTSILRVLTTPLNLNLVSARLTSIFRTITQPFTLKPKILRPTGFFERINTQSFTIQSAVTRLRTVPRVLPQSINLLTQAVRRTHIYRTLSQILKINTIVERTASIFRTVTQSFSLSFLHGECKINLQYSSSQYDIPNMTSSGSYDVKFKRPVGITARSLTCSNPTSITLSSGVDSWEIYEGNDCTGTIQDSGSGNTASWTADGLIGTSNETICYQYTSGLSLSTIDWDFDSSELSQDDVQYINSSFTVTENVDESFITDWYLNGTLPTGGTCTKNCTGNDVTADGGWDSWLFGKGDWVSQSIGSRVQGDAEIMENVSFNKQVSYTNDFDETMILNTSVGLPSCYMKGSAYVKDPDGNKETTTTKSSAIDWNISVNTTPDLTWTINFYTKILNVTRNETTVEEAIWKRYFNVNGTCIPIDNVKSYAPVSEDYTSILLYLNESGTLVDKTDVEEYSVYYNDTDDNGITDKLDWTIPTLSMKRFVIKGKGIQCTEKNETITNAPIQSGENVQRRIYIQCENSATTSQSFEQKYRIPFDATLIRFKGVEKSRKVDVAGAYITISGTLSGLETKDYKLTYVTPTVSGEISDSFIPTVHYTGEDAFAYKTVIVTNNAESGVNETITKYVPIRYGKDAEITEIEDGNETDFDTEDEITDTYRLELSEIGPSKSRTFNITYYYDTATSTQLRNFREVVNGTELNVKNWKVKSISQYKMPDVRMEINVDPDRVVEVRHGQTFEKIGPDDVISSQTFSWLEDYDWSSKNGTIEVKLGSFDLDEEKYVSVYLKKKKKVLPGMPDILKQFKEEIRKELAGETFPSVLSIIVLIIAIIGVKLWQAGLDTSMLKSIKDLFARRRKREEPKGFKFKKLEE